MSFPELHLQKSYQFFWLKKAESVNYISCSYEYH